MFPMTMKQDDGRSRSRKQAAADINQAMTRFPMIVNVLGQLREAKVPFPGDEDLARGCERAMTSILGALTRIPPAETGGSSKTEEIARGWLSKEGLPELFDADQLQRMHQIIEAVLGADPRHH